MTVINPISTDELQAARLLLARLGITPEQLLTTAPTPQTVPTLGDYIEQVIPSVGDGARRTYGSYWNRIRQAWGSRRLDEPTPLEIQQLAGQFKTNVVRRRNSRSGRSAAEHALAALRCLYRQAVADGLISQADNPAARVPLPRRLPSTRRALTTEQVIQIIDAATSTGNDPDLDGLILRMHIETACRRGGALELSRHDLDPEQCLIQLHEKGETIRWQPVSPTLMRTLLAHAAERGAQGPDDQVLRYRNGCPITNRRYDHLWQRIGRRLPWVARQQVTTHWLRHTTLTWVERNFGYAVARAYAGHSGKNDAGTTTTYVRANIEEVAAALAMLTGEEHPLAVAPRQRARSDPEMGSPREHAAMASARHETAHPLPAGCVARPLKGA
jgi:integrase